jgi:hypothetical protein
MDAEQLKAGTVIGNVNVLDLTRATEASIAAIREIGNVNVLVYSRATAPLVPRLAVRNVNVSVQMEGTPKVTIGHLVIGKEPGREGAGPVDHVVVGQVLVEPDVTSADLEMRLRSLVVVGQAIYPESVRGTLQAKTAQIVGQSMAYPATGRLMKGSVTLDEGLLAGLEEGTELVVLGSLRVPQVLPAQALERKIARLHVTGSVRCPEENAAAIRARLSDGSGRMVVVPAGYVVVEKPLVLDAALLESLPGSRLYCLAGVQIEADVEAARLDACLEGLVAREMVLCPAGLRGVLAHKCDLLQTQVVFYEGTLWLVSGAERLAPSRFTYLEGKATLVVEGKLTIDAEVEPRVLAERLAKVHNMGLIVCTKEQRGALEARLGLKEGEITDGAEPEEAEGEKEIGNVNYLVL